MCRRCGDHTYDCGYHDPLYTKVIIEKGKKSFAVWAEYLEGERPVTRNIATCGSLESILAVLKGLENRLAIKAKV